jgi:leucyl/phenylalanyl-tRNA---protein transferase
MSRLAWLSARDRPDAFPDPAQALREPNGLLAAGGDLSSARLLYAYRHGIFPWYESGQPILWWSPDPRAILHPEALRVSRSLRRAVRRGGFSFSADRAFAGVMAGCAAPRRHTTGTWITPEMREAYERLHRLGWAHSIETWQEGRLVGGLYGVFIGRVFFGESMFSQVSDASKAALVRLVEHLKPRELAFIDCQQATSHLARLGAVTVPRREFLAMLEDACTPAGDPGPWQLEGD